MYNIKCGCVVFSQLQKNEVLSHGQDLVILNYGKFVLTFDSCDTGKYFTFDSFEERTTTGRNV